MCSVAVWHWYSTDLAVAAVTFARRCADLEAQVAPAFKLKASRDAAWPESVVREHRSCAIASVLASVAFLEASLNELFASAEHPNLEVGGNLPVDDRRRLVATRDMVQVNRFIERFQLTLHLLNRSAFDPGSQPLQDAQLLVRLRNELTHYKPIWRPAGDDAMNPTDTLSKGLRSKGFALNPLTGPGNPYFPDQCLGYGCTWWAWTAALAFADAFFDRIGVEPVHDQFRGLFEPT
jgi:hypothetical protein